jgi:hypothetical protein
MELHIGWPQGVILAMCLADLCCVAFLHGRKTEKKWNFWVKVADVALLLAVLAWGGFFR